MIDTKALREKVLDLAIRGKLVPQDPNDEPATVLLERIREQKKQMVKDGKLKAKDIKNDTIIFKGDDNLHYEQFADGTVKCIEDEIPFEIPENWIWVRLGDLAQYKRGPFGSSITKAMFIPDSPTAIKVYEQKNAINKDASLGNYFISSEKYESLKGFEIFPNDIIVSCAGTIGETYIMPKNMRKGIINQALMKISLYDLEISEFYLMYFDFQLKSEAKEQGYGVALKNIPPFDILKKYLIPLPPLQEQTRIMQQAKALLTVIDNIDSNANELSKTIVSIKSKILDLAIRGKLVPQNPDDEPASVLLERIRAEKEELIKAGKIKRDKKESIIFKGDDNSYYQDIPKGWELCAIADIAEVITGGTPSKANKDYYGGDFPFFKPADLDQGINTVTPTEWLSESGKLCSRIIPAKSTLVCCIGTIGKSGYANVECATNQQINAIIPYVNPKYVYWFCNSQFFKNQLQSRASATTVSIVNKKNTAEIPFLLPPLAEQKRIVEAIEIVFAQLDEISNAIA